MLYSEIVKSPQFYLDKEGRFYPEATCFLLIGNNLAYLYKIVHSQIVTFFFKTFYAGGGLGEHGYRYKKAFFEKLPVPLWTGSDGQKRIVAATLTTNIEKEIAQLYELADAEIKLITSEASINS